MLVREECNFQQARVRTWGSRELRRARLIFCIRACVCADVNSVFQVTAVAISQEV